MIVGGIMFKLKQLKFVLVLGATVALTMIFQNCGKVAFNEATSVSAQCVGAACNSGLAVKTKAVLSLGIMTKTISCVVCHTQINGDISGFGTMTFRNDSEGQIFGNVYASDEKLQTWTTSNGQYVLDQSVVDNYSDANLIQSVLPELSSFNLDSQGSGNNISYSVKHGEEHNKFNLISFGGGGNLYTLTSMDPAKRVVASSHLAVDAFTARPIIHESDFPSLDLSVCQGVSGSVTLGNGVVLNSPINENLVLMHGNKIQTPLPGSPNLSSQYDKTCPSGKTLTISGQVVVNGDLILAGCIKGQGTLYATGNIYIPDDLKNVQSAFPYSKTVDENTLKQEVAAKSGKDMISLGSMKFIVIGALKMNVLSNGENPPIFAANAGTIQNVLNWLGTTQSNSSNIFTNGFLKLPYDRATAPGAVALVEANLYANLGVAGTFIQDTNSNIIINGSLMSPNLSLLSSGWSHNSGGAINTFNGLPYDFSQLNQDYRLKYSESGYECHRVRFQ